MSVKVMGLVWDYYPIGGGDMLTALKLADHADHDGGNIWPSIHKVATLTMQSDRTVQRQMRRMHEIGWLIHDTDAPARRTRTYRIPIELIPDGVQTRVTICHPGVTNGASRGDTAMSGKGDTAMSPESSLTVSTSTVSEAAGTKATPTAACWQAYKTAIKDRWGVEPPASAKTNGQLSQLVARLGAEPALQVIPFYVASSRPFYSTVRHSVGVLLKDCEALWMDLQLAGEPGQRPTKTVECQYVDRPGAEPCGMPNAKPDPLYGMKPICEHHHLKLAKPAVTLERVNEHMAAIKQAARARA